MLATIDPIALRLGPISIHWYAICIVSVSYLPFIWLSVGLLKRELTLKTILDFILLAFPIAIVGARLYYVIFLVSVLQSKILLKFLQFGMVELPSMVA